MSIFHIFLLVAGSAAFMYGYLLEHRLFLRTQSKFALFVDRLSAWLNANWLAGFLLLVLSTALAILFLSGVLIAELSMGSSSWQTVVERMCLLLSLFLFVVKGFSWSWLVRLMQRKVG